MVVLGGHSPSREFAHFSLVFSLPRFDARVCALKCRRISLSLSRRRRVGVRSTSRRRRVRMSCEGRRA